MTSRLYFDNNSSTLMDPRIKNYLLEVVDLLGPNPSSIHQQGKKVRALIAHARSEIAEFLRVKPTEIVFTSSGTESANLAIRGILANFGTGHIISSSVEHSCVYTTLKTLPTCYETTFLNPGSWGAVSPEQVEKAIRPETKLVALMAANNETGVKTDIEAIAALAKKRGIPLFVDATALIGKDVLSIPDGVSLLSFSGHKIHALQGAGVLFIRSGVKLAAQITGGDQELGKRAGTENVLGILCLAKAISFFKGELEKSILTTQEVRDYFEKMVLKNYSFAQINGKGPRISNVSNVAFKGYDGESLLFALDAAGVSASHGSACSSGALEPSRVLINMDLPIEIAKSSIRFSFSKYNTIQEVDQLLKILERLFSGRN